MMLGMWKLWPLKWHCRHGGRCYYDRNSKSIRIMTVCNICSHKNHPPNIFYACVSFWQILTSKRLNMCPDHTMLFPTFSSARGMALKWTCFRQFIHWRFVWPHETKYDGACRAIRTLVQQEEVTPSLTCVAHTNGASLWRADFSGTDRPTSLNNMLDVTSQSPTS